MNKAAKIQTQLDIMLHSLNAMEERLTEFCLTNSVQSSVDLSFGGAVTVQSADGKPLAMLSRSDESAEWSLIPTPALDKLQFPR